MAVARDGCVVETEPLAVMVDSFVRDWNRSRPPSEGGKFERAGTRRQASPVIGAITWLSSETGIPRETIQAVARNRWRTTELRIADSLVTALGRPEVFHDGTLRVRPRIDTPANRQECCGGSESLNGAAFPPGTVASRY